MALGDDRSTRVVSFLAKLRGLGHLDDHNLDEQLHSRRFELLQLRQELGSLDDDPLLPNRLPSHRDIHNEVLYGKTPKIHQIVAHVLYPDQVPWPKNQETAPFAPLASEGVGIVFSQSPSMGIDDSQSLGPAANASDSLRSKNSRDGGRRSQNVVTSRNEELQNDIEQKKAELSKGLLWLQRKRSAGTLNSPRSKGGKSPRSGGMEIELRGQRLNSTVKGYACVPVTEESVTVSASGLKDETRQERLEIEREAKLEKFREQKLLDKIKELEDAKAKEVQLQEDIQTKEEKRRQRNALLKKKIEKEITKKFAQEREEAEQKKLQKAKEEEEAKKKKQYHEGQKDKLAEWWHQKNEAEFSQEALKIMDKPKEQRRRNLQVTQKQKEAEDKARDLKWAMEERPPLPPRAHDLKGPPLTDRDVRSLKAVPMSWEVTAKTVSGAYGLSKKEYSSVTERTVRGVNGAGRMALYDL